MQAQLKEASAQAAAVQVSTVDAFQGAEREIMLLSSVRSRVQPNEFVDSARRINVAISRARRSVQPALLRRLPDRARLTALA